MLGRSTNLEVEVYGYAFDVSYLPVVRLNCSHAVTKIHLFLFGLAVLALPIAWCSSWFQEMCEVEVKVTPDVSTACAVLRRVPRLLEVAKRLEKTKYHWKSKSQGLHNKGKSGKKNGLADKGDM